MTEQTPVGITDLTLSRNDHREVVNGSWAAVPETRFTLRVAVIYVPAQELVQFTAATPNRPTIYGVADTFSPSGLFPGLQLVVNDLFDTSAWFGE